MTMVSAEGGRYTGETNMEGKRQGRGEYIWPNNDRYMGDFADGVKNGNGILYFANGDKRVRKFSLLQKNPLTNTLNLNDKISYDKQC